MIPPTAALIAALLFVPTADEPAVTLRFEKPAAFLEAVIALFRDSPAPDPATALANWKRATNGKLSLGKGAEAAIAVMNPAMVGELKTLDAAEILLSFDADGGASSWSLAVPKDDGTFAAFATAMALTDGASEPPLGSMAVDRLGKAGAPLMGREGETVVIGSSRAALSSGLAVRGRRRELGRVPGSIEARIDARGLERSAWLHVRRLGGAIRGLGLDALSVNAGLDPAPSRSELWANVNRPGEAREPFSTIDPSWVSALPGHASVAFSVAIDPRPEAWDRFFDAVDRVEKADRAAANRAPIRARIGLTARLAGLDLERDLWPRLRGVSGYYVGTIRQPEAAALALHVVDREAVVLLRDRFLPSLARSLRLERAAGPRPRGGAKALAEIAGKTLWISSDTTSVWIGWGDRPVATPVAGAFDAGSPKWQRHLASRSRLGWVYPARLGLAPAGSPILAALDACGPIRWVGEDHTLMAFDMVTWNHLDRGVRRFLELVPQQPAPAPPK